MLGNLFSLGREVPPPDRPQPVFHGLRHFVNGRPLDPPFPDGCEQVVFGMGCFWGAERKFWEAGDGVYVTAVGYAGGFTPQSDLQRRLHRPLGPCGSRARGLRPKRVAFQHCSKFSGKATTRRRGCGRATTSARNIVR